MRCSNTCKGRITQQAGIVAAQRGIGHHRHAMLFTPWQQITFNATVTDAVRDLISGTTIALWNAEQLFKLTDTEVRYAPGANLAHRS